MFKSAEIMMLRQIHHTPELDPERMVGRAQAEKQELHKRPLILAGWSTQRKGWEGPSRQPEPQGAL